MACKMICYMILLSFTCTLIRSETGIKVYFGLVSSGHADSFVHFVSFRSPIN